MALPTETEFTYITDTIPEAAFLCRILKTKRMLDIEIQPEPTKTGRVILKGMLRGYWNNRSLDSLHNYCIGVVEAFQEVVETFADAELAAQHEKERKNHDGLPSSS